MVDQRYVEIASPYGTLGLCWGEAPAGLRVTRIYLPNQWAALGSRPLASEVPGPIVALADQMRRFLGGEPLPLPRDLLALEACSAFQRRVLLAEYGVPRGQVTTYGRLAAHLGVPGGARAVGGALARNPFPIVIPCHRAVAADGGLGGFQGGLTMKRALLEAEGVTLSEGGRVLAAGWCY